jgi:uncharacterized protein YndB with AHSA1/START domain
MTERSVTHATIIERTYAATPAHVFAAWSSRDPKASWAVLFFLQVQPFARVG